MRKIDLAYWMDASAETVRHLMISDGSKRSEAGDLMKIGV
jgi:hypothetical protein